MEPFNVILIALGTSVATGFGQWFFFRRKNTADAISAEISNYRMIIKDLIQAGEDWKKIAGEWKDQADNYRDIYMKSRIKIDELENKVRDLEEALVIANKKITALQKLSK